MHYGVDKLYYRLVISYRLNENEQRMLSNLHKQSWTKSLKVTEFGEREKSNIEMLKKLKQMSELYNKWIQKETKLTREEFEVQSVGQVNPKKKLEEQITDLMGDNTLDCLTSMVNSVVF